MDTAASATVTLESVEVRLSPDLARRLSERLREIGQEPDVYLAGLLEKDLSAKPPSSLAELFAPVQAEFRASGMTEDQLDGFLDELREEVRHEKAGGAK